MIAFLAAAALLAAGCGGGGGSGGALRVTSLSITAAVGFPGPPSAGVTLSRGKTFARIARLVPLPLPHPAPQVPHVRPSRAPSARDPDEMTVCFPMDLTIGLSNGKHVDYPSCNRPRSLRPVVAALCPLLHKPGFCSFYRNELH